MPYNGSGQFSRVHSWQQDAANNIDITDSRCDAEDDGFATGLSTAICRDGQSTITNDIPFANHKITGLANGTVRTDAAALGQVQDGTTNWIAAGGTADAITATYSPAHTVLVDGMICWFRASAANATTTPTFAPDGLTAHTITKKGGSALLAGDIPAALAEIILRYNIANTRWELVNVAGVSGPASSTSGNLASFSGTTGALLQDSGLLATSVWSTGDVKTTLKTTADTGWVMMNDGTIGDASSGATNRANTDTSALFTLLWTNCSNTNCPVSTGRGASATADFAAHKTITLPKILGRALGSAGAGSGLTSRALGDTVGEETHTLTTAESASHFHSTLTGSNFINANGASAPVGTGAMTWGQDSQTNASGGGGAHNNMQPSSFLNFMIKL